MTTVRELYEGFSAATGEDLSTCRYVARVLQDADIFPTGKGGQGQQPQLSDRLGVMYLLGYYGAKKPKDAARVATSLADTITDEGEFKGLALVGVICNLLEAYRQDPEAAHDLESLALTYLVDKSVAELTVSRTSTVRHVFATNELAYDYERQPIQSGVFVNGLIIPVLQKLLDTKVTGDA